MYIVHLSTLMNIYWCIIIVTNVHIYSSFPFSFKEYHFSLPWFHPWLHITLVVLSPLILTGFDSFLDFSYFDDLEFWSNVLWVVTHWKLFDAFLTEVMGFRGVIKIRAHSPYISREYILSIGLVTVNASNPLVWSNVCQFSPSDY